MAAQCHQYTKSHRTQHSDLCKRYLHRAEASHKDRVGKSVDLDVTICRVPGVPALLDPPATADGLLGHLVLTMAQCTVRPVYTQRLPFVFFCFF